MVSEIVNFEVVLCYNLQHKYSCYRKYFYTWWGLQNGSSLVRLFHTLSSPPCSADDSSLRKPRRFLVIFSVVCSGERLSSTVLAKAPDGVSITWRSGVTRKLRKRLFALRFAGRAGCEDFGFILRTVFSTRKDLLRAGNSNRNLTRSMVWIVPNV